MPVHTCSSDQKTLTIQGVTTATSDSYDDTCKSIETVTFGSDVLYITNNFFRDHQNVQKVIIPSSIQSITNICFCWCPKLSYVSIPSSVTLASYSFVGNDPNISFELSGTGDLSWDTESRILYQRTTLIAAYPNVHIFEIPNIIQIISAESIKSLNMEVAVFHAGITSIQADIFLDSPNLICIHGLPETESSTAWSSNNGCSLLLGKRYLWTSRHSRRVHIPEIVEYIEWGSFRGCINVYAFFNVMTPPGIYSFAESYELGGIIVPCGAKGAFSTWRVRKLKTTCHSSTFTNQQRPSKLSFLKASFLAVASSHQ